MTRQYRTEKAQKRAEKKKHRKVVAKLRRPYIEGALRAGCRTAEAVAKYLNDTKAPNPDACYWTAKQVCLFNSYHKAYIRIVQNGYAGAQPVTSASQRAAPKRLSSAEFYASRAWQEVRYKALVACGAKCGCCGATAKSSGKALHVDHVKPRFYYPDLELDLSNLQVLCADCNLGKGAWDETDWREKVDS